MRNARNWKDKRAHFGGNPFVGFSIGEEEHHGGRRTRNKVGTSKVGEDNIAKFQQELAEKKKVFGNDRGGGEKFCS